jgi:hypothetical protein
MGVADAQSRGWLDLTWPTPQPFCACTAEETEQLARPEKATPHETSFTTLPASPRR